MFRSASSAARRRPAGTSLDQLGTLFTPGNYSMILSSCVQVLICLTLPLEQLPSTLIFKLRTESVEAPRAGMDQHMEVTDVSDDDGGGGGRTPLYLSRRQLAALRRQRLEHWKMSLWHSRCPLGAFSVGSSG